MTMTTQVRTKLKWQNQRARPVGLCTHNVPVHPDTIMRSSLTVMHVAGAYLCVRAYGNVASTYSLKAVYTQCPSDFTLEGEQMVCSSKTNAPVLEQRHTSCTADGTCNCKAPFAKPLPEVYDGMLFIDPSLLLTVLISSSGQHCIQLLLPA